MHPIARLARNGLLLAALLPPAVHADVFGFVDEKGVRNYTDIPSDRRAHLLWRDINGPKAIFLPSGGNFLYNFPPALLPDLEAAARAHSVDPLLLKALVSIESRANPKARSPKGAMGLTQLMPETAKRYGVRNPYDSRQNLNGGAHYMRDLLTLFRDDVHLALAAFNAGENAVIRNGNRIPPYAETERYVPAVLEQMAIFRRQDTPRS
jgi:soluble lytic murein transglycosylase-like protein